MRAPEPLSDAEARELLRSYEAGWRDRAIDALRALASRVLCACASPTYRRLAYEMHRRGNRALFSLTRRHPPFTEPMEADFEGEGGDA